MTLLILIIIKLAIVRIVTSVSNPLYREIELFLNLKFTVGPK
jgi:hypothetical protein